MKYDSIVIGSGFSGLTAAIILQKNGHKVLVLEKGKTPAPLIRRFKRNGVWCDVGFHYAGGFKRTTMSTIFKYLGIWDSVTPVLMNTQVFDRIFYNDKVYEIPCGIDNVRQAYLKYFPKSAVAVNAYIDYIKTAQDTTPFINFDADFDEESLTKARNTDMSLYDFLKGHGAEDEFINITGNYCYALCGSDGSEIPMYYHALIMGAFYDSAYTFNRGGDEIISALTEAFITLGGEIICSDAAAMLETGDRGKTLKAVRTVSGKYLECEYCLFTPHPLILSEMLPQGAVKPAFINRLKGHENTVPFFIIWLHVENVPNMFKATNNYTFNAINDGGDYMAVMACDDKGDEKKALNVISLFSEEMPIRSEYEQRSTNPAYYAFKKRYTERILKKLEALFPELTGNYKVLDAASPYTLERYTSTPGGSAYGVKHTVNQSELIPVTSIRGLYLCGQSVKLPGLMGTMISALVSTAMIFGFKNIWTQVRAHNV